MSTQVADTNHVEINRNLGSSPINAADKQDGMHQSADKVEGVSADLPGAADQVKKYLNAAVSQDPNYSKARRSISEVFKTYEKIST